MSNNNEKLYRLLKICYTTFGGDWKKATKKAILGTKQLGFAELVGSGQQGGWSSSQRACECNFNVSPTISHSRESCKLDGHYLCSSGWAPAESQRGLAALSSWLTLQGTGTGLETEFKNPHSLAFLRLFWQDQQWKAQYQYWWKQQ